VGNRVKNNGQMGDRVKIRDVTNRREKNTRRQEDPTLQKREKYKAKKGNISAGREGKLNNRIK